MLRVGRWLQWRAYSLMAAWRPATQQLRGPPWALADLPVPCKSLAAPVPDTPLIRPAVYGHLPAPEGWREWPEWIVYPQPAVTRLADVVILPGSVVIDRARAKVFPSPISMEPRSGLDIKAPRLGFQRDVVERPAFLVDCRYAQFGHILLEAVPRLMLLDGAPPEVEIITSLPLSPMLMAMAGAIGVDTGRFRHFKRPQFVREAYVPDLLVRLEADVHPLAREAFARIGKLGARANIAPVERLYLSRSGIGRRRLGNEAEIEALFSRYGFTIVRPEEHSLETQIALAQGARMIAGLGGSAMHLTVFSPPETRVLIAASTAWVSKIDVLIAQNPGQLAYVLGPADETTAPAYLGNWSVDAGAVETAIRSHFDL